MKLSASVAGVDAVRRELQRISDDFSRGKATSMALNKVAEKAQVEIRRAITERYVIKADEVRASMALRRAAKKSARLEAQITIFGSPTRRGRSMNLVRFLAAVQAAGRAMKARGAKATKKQLSGLERQIGFAIKRGGGLKTIQGAFLANKGRTVFIREGKDRLPIKPVQVIGVSQMFSGRAIRQRVLAKISADLPVEMKRAVDEVLRKRGG